MVDTTFSLSNLSIGQEIPSYKVHISKTSYRKYNRLIKEINAIHISKNYAQNLGYDDIVVAGNFLFTYIPKWIINWIEKESWLRKISIRFENPVYVDEDIIHKGKITEIKHEDDMISIICEYWVEKSNGVRTSYGEILLIVKLKEI